MKRTFIFLATGVEEAEAVITIDLLRRGGVDVTTVSITGAREVRGAHDIVIMADLLFEEANYDGADALVLPGGGPGSQMLNAHKALNTLLVTEHARGAIVAAICAAPMVLASAGLLEGRRATWYPGMDAFMTGAHHEELPVVIDGQVVTGKGPGFAFDFGLALVRLLAGDKVADSVKSDLLL